MVYGWLDAMERKKKGRADTTAGREKNAANFGGRREKCGTLGVEKSLLDFMAPKKMHNFGGQFLSLKPSKGKHKSKKNF